MKFVIQKKIVVWSVFLIPFFACAMEQEVPQISSTAVAVVEQDNLPPNSLLKEFFVKSAWQKGFDQAQFYKNHPEMFGAKTDIPKTLPNLDPDVCKNVLQYVFPYTKTPLGMIGLSKADKYSIESDFDAILFCHTLNHLRVIKVDSESKDKLFTWVKDGIDVQFSFQIRAPDENKFYRVYDYYAGKNNTDPFKYVSIDGFSNHQSAWVDGINSYGNFAFLHYFVKRSGDSYYKFEIFNIDPWDKVLPDYKSYCYAGTVTAFGLHYASNRVGICSFDYNKKNAAKICVYDFDMLLKTQNKNSLITYQGALPITWQGALPETFKKCIFITTSTLLGITYDGKLYSMALEKDKSISVHRQFVKDADKKDFLMKDMAVDFMDPRRVVFIDTKKEELYFMDLKSKNNSFTKIQDKLFQDPVGSLHCGDGHIGIRVEHKYFAMHEMYIQNFDYIPEEAWNL